MKRIILILFLLVGCKSINISCPPHQRWDGNKCVIIPDPIACTMDAKQCPDRSYVGRTGPDCEFVCPLTEEQAVMLATEQCTEGELTDTVTYNEITKTWWIDLDLEKDGCNPACVVSEKTLKAEINWRCTGLLRD